MLPKEPRMRTTLLSRVWVLAEIKGMTVTVLSATLITFDAARLKAEAQARRALSHDAELIARIEYRSSVTCPIAVRSRRRLEREPGDGCRCR